MRNTLTFVIILCTLLATSTAFATVSGKCSNCHTMHNSQGGTNDTTLSGDTVAEVGRSLTKGDCVGCHTGTVSASATNGIPYVMSGDATGYGPDYNASSGALETGANSLAGGTFNYVGAGGLDTTGHNVFGVSGPDTVTSPPGWVATTFTNYSAGNAVGDNWGSKQLTCAGTNGCHGNHGDADDFADISGAHHGDDTTIDGTSVAKSYRFLRGIIGYEDGDWELTVTSADHNTYYGVDRNTTATGSMDKKTISYLCAQCHGAFHGSDAVNDTGIIFSGPGISNSNPWLRHPTDFSLSSTSLASEYLSYADASGALATTPGTTAVYNFVAPLASALVTTAADNNTKASSVLPPAGAITNPFASVGNNDIVTCLSCHRAHGSPYADLLRWDYTKMEAGVGGGFANKGCFACHTSKD